MCLSLKATAVLAWIVEKKIKINEDVQDWLTSFGVFFSPKYQHLPCWSKIWDDRISFTCLLGLSRTIKILAKKKKAGQIMKPPPPQVDHILFHLRQLSQNATKKDLQHSQWTHPVIEWDDFRRELSGFFTATFQQRWNESRHLKKKKRDPTRTRISCSSWVCKICVVLTKQFWLILSCISRPGKGDRCKSWCCNCWWFCFH